MDKNRNLPFGSFNSLTLFTGLCIGISPAAALAADNGSKKSDDTLVVTAQTPSLYAPNTSADPKFTRPLVDTTRTMTVIPDQVMKDQGVNNLTDALKNVPGVGALLCRGKWQFFDR
jgi:Outer membrane receptor for monomeric catechols